MHGFEEASGQEHVALTVGDFSDGNPVLTRIHSECLTGDALFSRKCDCGPQLEAAIGLINKIRAYHLQDQGMDTVEANLALGLPVDARDFRLAQYIYEYLGIRSVKLLTNNPEKIQTLKDAGINVVERIPLHVGENLENERYLQTKADKLGHLMSE